MQPDMELPAFFLLGAVGGASAVYLFMRLRLKQQEQELLTARALLSNEQDKSLAIEKIEKQLRENWTSGPNLSQSHLNVSIRT